MTEIENILSPLGQFWTELSAFLLPLSAALLIIFVGWIVAKILHKTSLRGLKLVKLESLSERSGLDDLLVQGGVRYTTSSLIAAFIYWSVLLTFVLAGFRVLGIGIAEDLIKKIVFYFPNVLVAVVIIIFGTLLANFAKSAVYTYLSNINFKGAKPTSHVAKFSILIFVFSVALEHLSIGGEVLVSAFQLAFGAACLAVGLAFGLGGRDAATELIDKMLKR